MSRYLGSGLDAFYKGYGFVQGIQNDKDDRARQSRLDQERVDARLENRRRFDAQQGLAEQRFDYTKGRDVTLDERNQRDYERLLSNDEFSQDMRQADLGLRRRADARSARTSDLAYEQSLQADQKRRRTEAATLLQNIFTNEKGEPLASDQITQAHIDRAIPVLNQIDGLTQFGAVNPDVDQQNPFAGARLVPGEDGGEPRVVFDLRRKDGKTGEMTVDRQSGTNADLLAPTLSQIKSVIINELDPEGAAKRRASYAAEKFKTDEKIRLEQAKQGPGGANATTSGKKYQEMLSLGVPDHVARGVAYGTIKQIKDEYGMTTALVDLSSGKSVGGMQRKAGSRGFEFVENPEWKPEASLAPTGRTTGATSNAPQAALDFLRQNPQMAEQFKAKYGYLPEGY